MKVYTTKELEEIQRLWAGALKDLYKGTGNTALGYYAGSDIDNVNNTTTIGYLAPGVHSNGAFSVGYDGSTLLTILSDGKTGIGISNPSEKLVVDGDIVADTLKIDYLQSPTAQIETLNGEIQINTDNLPKKNGNLTIINPQYSTVNGSQNIKLGSEGLTDLTTGKRNTAIGAEALMEVTSGEDNVGLGASALKKNTIGNLNTALGRNALESNLSGSHNVAVGYDASKLATNINNSVAIGYSSLLNKNSGTENTAIGAWALSQDITGSGNTALGYSAGSAIKYASYTTTIGYRAPGVNTTGTFSVGYNNNTLVTILGDGKTGIGITNPSEKLEVDGDIVADTIKAKVLEVDKLVQKQIEITTLNNELNLNSPLVPPNSGNVVLVNETYSGNEYASQNIKIGDEGYKNLTNAHYNIGIGKSTLSKISSGNSNIGVGVHSLSNNTEGDYNIGIGYASLSKNVTGNSNIGIGRAAAMQATNTSGTIAIGDYSLFNKKTGDFDIGIGQGALQNDTTGTYNTAIGFYSGNSITTASLTTTLGYKAPGVNTYGTFSVGYDGNTLMTILNNGKMGIGTTKPEYPLEIATKNEGEDYLNLKRVDYSNTNFPTESTMLVYSIFTEGAIGTKTSLAVVSDERIKTNIETSDSKEDLATLQKIKVSNYDKIDRIKRHHHKEKKLIAQQLEKVYPTAVSQSYGLVPDVYQFAKTATIQNKHLVLELESSPSLAIGEKLKLELIQVEDSTISESLDKLALTQINGNQLKFKLPPEQVSKLGTKQWEVFVYGRYVDDFRAVDYDAVSMLNVSATQELYKQKRAQDATIKAQQKKIQSLETQTQQILEENKKQGELIQSLVEQLKRIEQKLP